MGVVEGKGRDALVHDVTFPLSRVSNHTGLYLCRQDSICVDKTLNILIWNSICGKGKRYIKR